MRSELADQLGVSRRSLGSVSAYVEYSATEAVRDAGLVGRLSNADLVMSARLLRSSGTPHEDVDILAEGLGLTACELSTAVALYERYYQDRPDGKIGTDDPSDSGVDPGPPTQSTPAEGQTPSVARVETADPEAGLVRPPCVVPAEVNDPDADSADVAVETGVRGDTANYDFPAKHEWRRFWAGYIRDQYGGGRLRDALVVCLPGRAVEPEVSQYLAMGVRPENIYCVEGSARVRDEFLANAARLGVRAFPMSLEAALKRFAKEGLKFSIINFDFHGQHCNAHRLGVVGVPAADDAVIIYNALGKREGLEMQEWLLGEVQHYRRHHDRLQDVAREGSSLEQLRLLLRPVAVALTLSASDRPALQEVRRTLIPPSVVRHIGHAHRPLDRPRLVGLVKTILGDRLTEPGITQEDDLFEASSELTWPLRRICMHYFAAMIGVVKERYDCQVLKHDEGDHFGLALWHRLTGEPCIVGPVRTYEYLSEARQGRPRSPFVTTLGRVAQASSLLPDHEGAVQFGLTVITELMRMATLHQLQRTDGGGADAEGGTGEFIEVTDRTGAYQRPGSTHRWDDRLVARPARAPETSISLGELNAGINAARSLERKLKIQL